MGNGPPRTLRVDSCARCFLRRSPDELHTLWDSLSTGIFHQQVDVIDLKFLVEVLNDLNGAQRLNCLNDLNGRVPRCD